MLPREATPEMIKAGTDEIAVRSVTWTVAGLWRAMFDAAPAAPTAAPAIDALVHWLNMKWKRHGEIEDRDAAAALAELERECQVLRTGGVNLLNRAEKAETALAAIRAKGNTDA